MKEDLKEQFLNTKKLVQQAEQEKNDVLGKKQAFIEAESEIRIAPLERQIETEKALIYKEASDSFDSQKRDAYAKLKSFSQQEVAAKLEYARSLYPKDGTEVFLWTFDRWTKRLALNESKKGKIFCFDGKIALRDNATHWGIDIGDLVVFELKKDGTLSKKYIAISYFGNGTNLKNWSDEVTFTEKSCSINVWCIADVNPNEIIKF